MPEMKEPVFKCVRHGSAGFQVSVELNVSGSRVTVEPGVLVSTKMFSKFFRKCFFIFIRWQDLAKVP
jgi:hypothetical protein